MKYQKLCDEIITKVGGRDNVLDVSHCITRLRFHLKDESLAQTNELKATKGVVDVIQAGGQYQVVIGATVEAVYNDLVQIGGFDAKRQCQEGRSVLAPARHHFRDSAAGSWCAYGRWLHQVDACALYGCRLAR